ncbi:MAG: FHA domain-containing protein [Dehalococcoidia bacterium]
MNDATLILIRLAVLALLYLFLAAVIRVVWRDIAAAAPARRGAIGRAVLLVSQAPPELFKLGERIPIEGIASIGRDSDNQVVIPDKTVSGRHAALAFREGRWWVEDLGSTNGTWVNDRQTTGPTPLESADTIQIGRVAFELGR